MPAPIGTMATVKSFDLVNSAGQFSPPTSWPIAGPADVVMCYPDCLKDTYPSCIFSGDCEQGTELAPASPCDDITNPLCFCPPDEESNPPECFNNYECNFTSYKVDWAAKKRFEIL